MITIKLFGLLSTYGGPRQICVEAGTVREALGRAAEMGVDKKLLDGALVYVNGRLLNGIARRRCRLCCGDELSLLSPAGGG